MNDLSLMEAEADIYKAVIKLSEYSNTLNETVHLLNFSSLETQDVEFKKKFHKVLLSVSSAQYATIQLFETICLAHKCPLTD